ncbi:MAG TPA: RNA methyltransferase [Acidimicrobiales bacterium]|nr:RNA methyltransferase [Acidimicrobiales bacterium]
MSDGPLGIRHQRVQRLRRLLRRHSVRATDEAFVVEGVNVLEAALSAEAAIEAVYVAPEARQHAGALRLVDEARRRGIRVYELGAGVMERVADTVTPQPVCAVATALDVPLDAVTSSGDDPRGATLLVCVDMRDPGNLGAMLRCADASGTAAVVCCEGTVDPYNPKVVRASAGSLFNVPVVLAGAAGETFSRLAESGWRTLGTVARGGTDYSACDLTGRVAVVVGNEASGLPDELTGTLDSLVTIPMYGRTESLNVAMAATVLCFESARQRHAT